MFEALTLLVAILLLIFKFEEFILFRFKLHDEINIFW